ncbi:SSI family serine proteinase inhibitor [Streptosporangium sp. CA-135522]|uniref:SSI family serine proteinase inhibitor n=1 Tax=Streptosporangium sp. CA-135522 TaxID=3240072 RepID=UPI003D8DF560
MRIWRPINGRVRWLSLAAVASLVPLLGAAPAMATSSAPHDPVGAYLLTVAPEDDANTDPLRTATLVCGPDGGTHVNPATACEQLRRAAGRVGGVPEEPGPCTREYAPVRVTATGTWNGRKHRYTRTYPNRCTAIRATGGVLFAF